MACWFVFVRAICSIILCRGQYSITPLQPRLWMVRSRQKRYNLELLMRQNCRRSMHGTNPAQKKSHPLFQAVLHGTWYLVQDLVDQDHAGPSFPAKASTPQTRWLPLDLDACPGICLPLSCPCTAKVPAAHPVPDITLRSLLCAPRRGGKKKRQPYHWLRRGRLSDNFSPALFRPVIVFSHVKMG